MAHLRTSAAIWALALLTACGGGGANPLPHTHPPQGAALAPQGGTIALPPVSTYSGVLTYPANDAPANAAMTVAATTQTGTPLPGNWNSLWLNNPLVSYILVPSATVAFNGPLTLTVDLGSHMPPPPSGSATGLEIDISGFDLNAQSYVLSGAAAYPKNISGTTATFSVQEVNGGQLTLTAAHTYQLVLNYGYMAF